MRPVFDGHKWKLNYMDTDSILTPFKLIRGIFEDPIHFKEVIDSSDFDPSHEIYSKHWKKLRKEEIGNSSSIRFRWCNITKE